LKQTPPIDPEPNYLWIDFVYTTVVRAELENGAVLPASCERQKQSNLVLAESRYKIGANISCRKEQRIIAPELSTVWTTLHANDGVCCNVQRMTVYIAICRTSGS
jgi:hypothetical protein